MGVSNTITLLGVSVEVPSDCPYFHQGHSSRPDTWYFDCDFTMRLLFVPNDPDGEAMDMMALGIAASVARCWWTEKATEHFCSPDPTPGYYGMDEDRNKRVSDAQSNANAWAKVYRLAMKGVER